MATAFYGTMSIANNDGTAQIDRFDSTDVTLAYTTFKSNGGLTYVTVLKNGYLKDIVLNIAAAGTTLELKLWINARDTNIRWVQSACFPALPVHFPNNTPIPLQAGDMLQIQAI